MILTLLAAWAAPDFSLVEAEWDRDLDAMPSVSETVSTLERVRTLGRLRDKRTVPELTAALKHEDPLVRAAAVRSLGWTPGSEVVLERLLRDLKLPTDRVAALSTEFELSWQVVEAVGRQGSTESTQGLSALLQAHWPLDEAAARALLRAHRRGVDVTLAIQQLVDALDRPDPRTQIAVAQALTRIGLRKPSDVMVRRVAMLALSAPVEEVRVALLKTVRPHLEGDLRALVLERAWWDRALVRAAVLGSIQPTDTTALVDRVDAALTDPRWPVQEAAIDAAGRLGHEAALMALAQRTADVWVRARITKALELDASADDPWPVRAAAIGERTTAELVKLAGAVESEPGLRSAAMGELLGRAPKPSLVKPLLAAPDGAIRDAAVYLLRDAMGPEMVEELALVLRVERDANVVRSVLETLLAWSEKGGVARSRFLTSALKREVDSPSPAIRRAANELASTLGVAVNNERSPAVVRELILPDGTVTTTTGELPEPSEIERYRQAVVETSRGPVVLALDPEVAPLAVHNFVSLARTGFYDGLSWHRVLPGFVAQTGCPRGDGWGGPGWTIVDEVSDAPFSPGALGMARGDRDTAGSQFFVMTGPARFLDGDYTWFGKVVSGLDTVRELRVGDTIETVKIVVEAP